MNVKRIPTCLLLCFFVLYGDTIVAQDSDSDKAPPTPAAGEFAGYYNIPYRDVYRRSELNEETKKEFLFSGTEALPSFNIPEGSRLMTRIESLANEFEPPYAPFDPTGSKKGMSKTTPWFHDGGRSLVVSFTDPKQITRENCERIQSMLGEEFPLWRVVLAITGADEICPIIYPTAVAIPKAWREKEAEYWQHIRSIEEKSSIDQSDMQRVVVEYEFQKSYSRLTEPPNDLPKAIMLFRYTWSDECSSFDEINLWVLTDNPPLKGEVHVPRPDDNVKGFQGHSGTVLGVTDDYSLEENSFWGELTSFDKYKMRVYQLSFETDKFDRGAEIVRDPGTGALTKVNFPANLPVIEFEELKSRFDEIIRQREADKPKPNQESGKQ